MFLPQNYEGQQLMTQSLIFFWQLGITSLFIVYKVSELIFEMEFAWNQLEPLVEKQDAYDPDIQEIEQYAQYLGLTLPEDNRYLSLVREGLMAPLPPFWQACQAPTGQLLYRNRRTRQIMEDNPLDQIYRQKIQQIKKIQGNYGVHWPINQESALKESSGVMRQSKNYRSDLKLSKSGKNESGHRPSIIERHITEESQYSEFGSARDSKVKLQKEVPEWQKKHNIQVQKLKSNILNFFPEQSQLLRPLENYNISPQNIDPGKLRNLLELRQAVERRKIELQRLREQRLQLEGLCDT